MGRGRHSKKAAIVFKHPSRHREKGSFRGPNNAGTKVNKENRCKKSEQS